MTVAESQSDPTSGHHALMKINIENNQQRKWTKNKITIDLMIT